MSHFLCSYIELCCKYQCFQIDLLMCSIFFPYFVVLFCNLFYIQYYYRFNFFYPVWDTRLIWSKVQEVTFAAHSKGINIEWILISLWVSICEKFKTVGKGSLVQVLDGGAMWPYTFLPFRLKLVLLSSKQFLRTIFCCHLFWHLGAG